jgi:hypothetical protein
MLCEDNLENYDGLDSDRNTEEEIETAVRFFPGVLSMKDGRWEDIEDNDDDDEEEEENGLMDFILSNI